MTGDKYERIKTFIKGEDGFLVETDEIMQDIVRCKDCVRRGNPRKCIVANIAEKQDMPYFVYDNRGEWFCADGIREWEHE